MSQLPRFITDGGTRRPYADNSSGTLEPRFECCCDGDPVPCTDCYEPAGSGGADPNDGVIAGGPVACSGTNAAAPHNSESSTSDFCTWRWIATKAGGLNTFVDVWYAKNAVTVGDAVGGCAGVSLLAGEWAIQMWDEDAGAYWEAKTTGFSCDPSTGRISGTHAFGGTCDGTCAGANPTFTVAA